jgi:hypothetical protein
MTVTINGTSGIAGVDGSAGTPAIQGGDTNTGMFFPAADTIAFAEGGTEVMRIASDGSVGIGTTSPSAPIDVVSNSSGIGTRIRGRSSDSFGVLEFTNNGASAETARIAADSSNNLIFSNTGSITERMRIDSSGNLLVGTTTSGGKQTITQSADAVTAQFNNSAGSLGATIPGIQVSYGNAIPNNTGQSFLYVGDYSALRAQIRSNGGLANYSANNVNLSDRREKTNFAPAKSYLDVICAIPVQTFNYIDQNLEEDDGLTLGVIAQDVQDVAPELVSESNWGTDEEPKMRLSIYQTDLQYALMKCIQEQQALITALTARITALEAK